MANTTEFIGKIAHIVTNNLMEILGPSGDYGSVGLKGGPGYAIQAFDNDGMMHTFATIIGECDPDLFFEITTKEAANALVRSWFVPEYVVKFEELGFFKRYLDMHLTAAQLDHIDTLESVQDIYAYLLSEGFKFIRVTTFDGPQFDIPEGEV